MSQYTTKPDMISRYGETPLIELTDRADEPAGVIDDVVLNAAMVAASAEVDSYIASRYKLPLSAAPQVLVRHTSAIAYYILHRGRYTDEVRQEYDDALAFLKSLSTGAARLDVGGSEPQSTAAIAQVDDSIRVFNRKNLGSF